LHANVQTCRRVLHRMGKLYPAIEEAKSYPPQEPGPSTRTPTLVASLQSVSSHNPEDRILIASCPSRDDRSVRFRVDFPRPASCTLDRTHDLLCHGRYRQLLDLHVYHRLVSFFILASKVHAADRQYDCRIRSIRSIRYRW
jgi:hypothetical protein